MLSHHLTANAEGPATIQLLSLRVEKEGGILLTCVDTRPSVIECVDVGHLHVPITRCHRSLRREVVVI